jgi:hypothetical protein
MSVSVRNLVLAMPVFTGAWRDARKGVVVSGRELSAQQKAG